MKKVLSFIAACVLCLAAFTPVYAADQDMIFKITAQKKNTTMYIYSATKNKKVYKGQVGTAKCTTTNAPGYGYLICLTNSKNNVMSTKSQWLNYSGCKKYLGYLSGKDIVNDYYQAAGRFDNDYAGTYSFTGKFNSDKT